jgi:methionyl-tRNA synthetase
VITEADTALIETARGLPARIDAAMERYAPHEALAIIWELVDAANKYVEDSAPWALAKQGKADDEAGIAAQERLDTVLYHLVEALRLVAYFCQPFIPGTAAGIARQLSVQLTDGPNKVSPQHLEKSVWGGYPAGTTLAPGEILFHKHELPEPQL